MASLFDPRDSDLLGWLASLPERDELVARPAIRGLCDCCRGDPHWRRRVSELEAKHAPTAVALARLLREAEVMKRRFDAAATPAGPIAGNR